MANVTPENNYEYRPNKIQLLFFPVFRSCFDIFIICLKSATKADRVAHLGNIGGYLGNNRAKNNSHVQFTVRLAA